MSTACTEPVITEAVTSRPATGGRLSTRTAGDVGELQCSRCVARDWSEAFITQSDLALPIAMRQIVLRALLLLASWAVGSSSWWGRFLECRYRYRVSRSP